MTCNVCGSLQKIGTPQNHRGDCRVKSVLISMRADECTTADMMERTGLSGGMCRSILQEADGVSAPVLNAPLKTRARIAKQREVAKAMRDAVRGAVLKLITSSPGSLSAEVMTRLSGLHTPNSVKDALIDLHREGSLVSTDCEEFVGCGRKPRRYWIPGAVPVKPVAPPRARRVKLRAQVLDAVEHGDSVSTVSGIQAQLGRESRAGIALILSHLVREGRIRRRPGPPPAGMGRWSWVYEPMEAANASANTA